MLITLPLRLCEAETGQQREWINTPSAACIACLHCSAWVRHANAAHLNCLSAPLDHWQSRLLLAIRFSATLCGDSVAVIFPLSPVVHIVGHWDRLGVALGGFFSSPLYWTAVSTSRGQQTYRQTIVYSWTKASRLSLSSALLWLVAPFDRRP
ncbi:hypothetical protein T09_6977 [Trichinella sp. T9]|nr:hypothetical protein T09_6977 [Trichinella sp. T9]